MDGIMVTEMAKPFLRWAGGKSWFIKHLPQIIQEQKYVNYYEPFLGGGAVFFSLGPNVKAKLSDINAELINTYIQVRDNVDDVIDVLRTFENTADFYYEIRNKNFENLIEKAAQFIYLNQTSFNGLYRVNLRGQYNVPYGYRTKAFLEEDKLKMASRALSNSEIRVSDFWDTLSEVVPGDLFFLDPPYTTSHNNNGFVKYNQKMFSLDDQYRLSRSIDQLKEKGAYYILTNAAHSVIRDIFDKGDKIYELNRASLIGGDNASRGRIQEYVFTNLRNEV